MALVYTATNLVDGKRYVGFTTQTLAKRRQQHESLGRSATTHQPFQRAMKAHGAASFTWHVVADGLSEVDALRLEVSLIESMGTLAPAGYNLTPGGERTVHHPETRRRISQALLGHPVAQTTRDAVRKANIGRIHGPEHRRKTSEAGRRQVRTPEWGANISASKRKLSVAEAVGAAMLVTLGATATACAAWYSVDRSTVSNVLAGRHGWDVVVQSFLTHD